MTGETETFTPEQQALFQRLGEIFLPYATRKTLALYPNRNGTAKFVHYTSAEAALSIINTKRVWMRNAMCMADYREVNHGHDLLLGAKGKLHALRDAVDEYVPNVANEALNLFDKNWPQIRVDTFITSLSEHEDNEDLHGRLSMWRAFGAAAPRVAIVLRIPWLSGGAQALRLVFSPVAYMDAPDVQGQIEEVIASVHRQANFLKGVPREHVFGIIFTMLLTGVTCLKHPGFHEEREWRAIHGPGGLTNPTLMKKLIRSVNSIPQHVYEIPLDVTVSSALAELDISVAFDHLIVGPSQYAAPMVSAFTDALTGAGVADARAKIFVSGIPIRT